MKVLAGYTGLVGSHILRESDFDLLVNSKNSPYMEGKRFDLLVWAGVKAEKWRANQSPAEDLEHIRSVAKTLESVTAERAILISTIDVYTSPAGVSEDDVPPQNNFQPYGRHRLWLEGVFREHFPCHHIIRLPGLFGDGLKKNIIYDFLKGNKVTSVHSDAKFQFYCLDWLNRDISRAVENDIRILNLATEPMAVHEIAQIAFGIDFKNSPPEGKPGIYDFRSKYGALWQKQGPYLYERGDVIQALCSYVKRATKRGSP